MAGNIQLTTYIHCIIGRWIFFCHYFKQGSQTAEAITLIRFQSTIMVRWYGAFQGMVIQMAAAALVDPGDLLDSVTEIFSFFWILFHPPYLGILFTSSHTLIRNSKSQSRSRFRFLIPILQLDDYSFFLSIINILFPLEDLQ